MTTMLWDEIELGQRASSELLYENELNYWHRLFFVMRRTEQWTPLSYPTLLTFVRPGLRVTFGDGGAWHRAVCYCGWLSEPTGFGIAHARHLALTEHPVCKSVTEGRDNAPASE